MNELIFVIYIFVVAAATLAAAWFSREALIALLCLQTVLMNLFVAKEITLFGLTATASDALGVGGALCLNLLQEFYGVPLARRAIWLSFFCTLYYLLLSLLHCAYIPGCGDTSNVHFLALLLPMPRIIIVSLISYFLAQTADRRLYAFLSHRFSGRFFLLRNYASIALTQLLDTIIFTYGALWGIVSSPTEIIVVSYAIKLAVLLLATPFLLLAKKLLTQSSVEHV